MNRKIITALVLAVALTVVAIPAAAANNSTTANTTTSTTPTTTTTSTATETPPPTDDPAPECGVQSSYNTNESYRDCLISYTTGEEILTIIEHRPEDVSDRASDAIFAVPQADDDKLTEAEYDRVIDWQKWDLWDDYDQPDWFENTTTTTTTSTPTTTTTTTASNVTRVDASTNDDGNSGVSLGGITVQLGQNSDGINTDSVVGQIGSVTIHDYRYHGDTGEMWIDVTVNNPTGAEIAVSDAFTGLGAGQGNIQTGVQTSQNSYIDLDQGTHRIKVPATVFQGYSRVEISVRQGSAKLTAQPGGSGFFGTNITLSNSLIAVALFGVGTVVRIGHIVYRANDSGQPETLDGTEIDGGTIGLKSEVSDDE